jgi:hypothetical protein
MVKAMMAATEPKSFIIEYSSIRVHSCNSWIILSKHILLSQSFISPVKTNKNFPEKIDFLNFTCGCIPARYALKIFFLKFHEKINRFI